MKWSRLGVCLLALGCGNGERVDFTQQSSCELERSFYAQTIMPLDILVVVDPRAASFLPDLDARLRTMMSIIELGFADMHIVVAGALASCTNDGQPFLVWRPRPADPPATNFDGKAEDAFACLAESVIDVYPPGGIAGALTAPGFRHGVARGVILISTTGGYGVQFPEDLDFAVIIAPLETAPTWIGTVAGHNVRFGVLSGDWIETLSFFGSSLGISGAPCIIGDVIAPEGCVVTESNEVSHAEVILPYCAGGSGPRPCWWSDPAPYPFTCPGGFAYRVQRDEYAPSGTTYDIRCPLACP